MDVGHGEDTRKSVFEAENSAFAMANGSTEAIMSTDEARNSVIETVNSVFGTQRNVFDVPDSAFGTQKGVAETATSVFGAQGSGFEDSTGGFGTQGSGYEGSVSSVAETPVSAIEAAVGTIEMPRVIEAVVAKEEPSAEVTKVEVEVEATAHKFAVKESDVIVRIYGVDKNYRGDSVFTVLLKGHKTPVFISHTDMKRVFLMQLIEWYEQFLTFGPEMQIGPYKPT